jgi:hypothetical protein
MRTGRYSIPVAASVQTQAKLSSSLATSTAATLAIALAPTPTSKDAALRVVLPPGVYTVQIKQLGEIHLTRNA